MKDMKEDRDSKCERRIQNSNQGGVRLDWFIGPYDTWAEGIQ
jgi:hypothetical protein